MSPDIMYNLICALLGVNVAVVSYYLRRHDRQHDMISKAVDELKNQRVLCVSRSTRRKKPFLASIRAWMNWLQQTALWPSGSEFLKPLWKPAGRNADVSG